VGLGLVAPVALAVPEGLRAHAFFPQPRPQINLVAEADAELEVAEAVEFLEEEIEVEEAMEEEALLALEVMDVEFLEEEGAEVTPDEDAVPDFVAEPETLPVADPDGAFVVPEPEAEEEAAFEETEDEGTCEEAEEDGALDDAEDEDAFDDAIDEEATDEDALEDDAFDDDEVTETTALLEDDEVDSAGLEVGLGGADVGACTALVFVGFPFVGLPPLGARSRSGDAATSDVSRNSNRSLNCIVQICQKQVGLLRNDRNEDSQNE